MSVVDRDSRRALVRRAADVIEAERSALLEAGIACELVSGGGTGTIDLAPENGILNEVQAGSYVLYDAAYAALDLPFRPAVFCVTTILSKRSSEFVVVNAGLKQLATDSGFPRPVDTTVSVLGMSDEHSRLHVPANSEYEIGDRVSFIPGHLDPTMNLHGSVFVYNHNTFEE